MGCSKCSCAHRDSLHVRSTAATAVHEIIYQMESWYSTVLRSTATVDIGLQMPYSIHCDAACFECMQRTFQPCGLFGNCQAQLC